MDIRMNMKVLIVVIVAFSLAACTKKVYKVACVGDSITEGSGISVQSKDAYPVVLDGLLGEEYNVLNLGRSATNMQKKADFPYWICKEFSNVFAFQPDIVVIKLGTNDTKPQNWNAINYEKDYQALIDTFKTISTNPYIYLCTPAPVFKTAWGINDSTVVNGVIPVIHKLAEINQLPIIDLYTQMLNQSANFPDGVHPNEQAVVVMANIISREIKK